MKIIHICLAAFYIEGWEYQENVLSRLHAQMGHQVLVITSNYTYNNQHKRIEREECDYINRYGVHVISLSKSHRYGYYSRFGDYDNLFSTLENNNPDIIFVHGGQFVGLKDVINYCKKNRAVRLYIDQHGDFYNMPIVSFKQKIEHKIIYGYWLRKAVKYCSKFWGVTPWRCLYLNKVYGIPKNKIDLLVMGGDNAHIHFDQQVSIRNKIRNELGLKLNDFVIVTGGKIDKTKNIHKLMEAINHLDILNVKLIVFGEPTSEMSDVFNKFVTCPLIKYVGWINSLKVYDYFLASDLAFFPGTHSVLWEQACATGLPGVFKDWEGMHHVDLGGNCIFLKNESIDNIEGIIKDIALNPEKFNRLKKNAQEKCIKFFSYQNIAKRAIEGE